MQHKCNYAPPQCIGFTLSVRLSIFLQTDPCPLSNSHNIDCSHFIFEMEIDHCEKMLCIQYLLYLFKYVRNDLISDSDLFLISNAGPFKFDSYVVVSVTFDISFWFC